jgi:hypothetical protein
MKSRKEKPTFDGIEFDSREEVEFYAWCKEAQANGFIRSTLYHPAPIELSPAAYVKEPRQLKTKVKMVERCLFRAHGYQPDFSFMSLPRFLNLAHGLRAARESEPMLFIVDIKGGFEPTRSKAQVFSINQKWAYAKYGIYINKVVPKEFFAKTWAPDIRHKRTGWKLEKYANCKSVEDVDREPFEMEFN